MSRKMGTKKTGGRAMGTPNKTTKELKDFFQGFISKNVETMQSVFDKLEPRDKLLIIEKFTKFILPTQVKAEIEDKTIYIPPVIHISTFTSDVPVFEGEEAIRYMED
ncbi:MAG: hypothetical protein LBE82_11520 [Chitinophagaceae bacterium]|jgi:hypothetical protein|nr:hypothetical protein [Chitinophagaceae bacterium]